MSSEGGTRLVVTDVEGEASEHVEDEPRRTRSPTRSQRIIIDDLDLRTVEGQDEFLLRAQKVLAREDLNSTDLKIIGLLKDTFKIKNDIGVLKTMMQMKKDFEQYKSEQKGK